MSVLAVNGGRALMRPEETRAWPPVGKTDERLVLQSLRSSEHCWGPNCVALEQEWAKWNGNRYAMAANSGTAALHMGIAATGCSAGDEVITTAFSWTSTGTSILHHNCIPVFVDIDFKTMNIDAKRIEAAITERTRAILPVHLHGLPADMDAIMGIAGRHKLAVIEDCCQAHGARYKGKKVGRFGDCAGFSLNQNKMLSAGEGGLFVTDDEAMARQARALMSFGEFTPPHEERDFHSYAMGWMYRTSDLNAAFARAQLSRLDSHIKRTRQLVAAADAELEGVRGLIRPYAPKGCEPNGYNYVLRLDPKALGFTGNPRDLRAAVVGALKAENVMVSTWQTWLLPQMTVFQARNGYGGGCPWHCRTARKVNYDLAQYPEAGRHVDTYFILTGLRPPNTIRTARRMAQAVRKVLDNINELEV